MASLLSILKKVIKLNSVHNENQSLVTVQVQVFGELHNEQQLRVHLRPIIRYQLDFPSSPVTYPPCYPPCAEERSCCMIR